VKRVVQAVEDDLITGQQFLKEKVTTPFASGYRPELDSTRELSPEGITKYQGHIGILRWICELGRLDIIVPVSMLSRYTAMPREGHLDQVLHTYAYLKKHARSRIVFNDEYPDFSKVVWREGDFKVFYPDAEEVLPPKIPEPRGKLVVTTCYVDADHAGFRTTRRSHTGVLLYANKAPVMWYSKRQNTVETSTFGSEYVAMKQCVDLIEGLRYKLRMLGVPVEGPTNVFCDNEGVVLNSTAPESPLKKKHNAIAYHRTREAIASGIIRIAKIDGEENLADILTKLMPGPKLHDMAQRVLF
jgi:hypothetical protein